MALSDGVLTVPEDQEGYCLSFDAQNLQEEREVENARDFFQKYGFVVFRSVLEQALLQQMQEDIWNRVVRATGKSSLSLERPNELLQVGH